MCDINKNEVFINISEFPINEYLEKLLVDKTTGKNIIFATDDYSAYGYDKHAEMTPDVVRRMDKNAIQPRVKKSLREQAERTKKKAEVFTPAWVCNHMNNHCDEEWFGRKDVFNKEIDTEDGKHTWTVTDGLIEFPANKKWQRYVDSKRLELTCGEAPYIVSRYDTATGEKIPLHERVGVFDRKMRIVNENTQTEEDWLKWAYRALQACYGYEFQGDNLLIARINMLQSFVEYMQDRLQRIPTKRELNKIINIIAWNIWQMDGITGYIPFSKPDSLFMDLFDNVDEKVVSLECKIYDWRSKDSLTYNSMKRGK
jgi:hypothetical protein